MGRRALPKIDHQVDLAGHLSFVDDLVEPFDPQSLFPKSQPLEIEIGSGKGLFVLQQSQRNEERNYLGNEIAKKYAQFAAFRLAQHERPNARMVSGDGLFMFRNLLPAECCVAVHVYFPDPWWKRNHRQRRVMRQPLITDIERVLKPGGELHFWTDVEQYFEESLKLIELHSTLIGPETVPESTPENDMDFRTHFERRMRMHGHDVFRSKFRKAAI